MLEAVIYDGKIEIQQWYACSEQGDLGLEDTLTVNYTSIQVIYETVTDSVRGDVNSDGEFTVADVVLLQRWLLGVPNTKLADWKAGDLCDDDRLDVFDLCLMKRELLNQ